MVAVQQEGIAAQGRHLGGKDHCALLNRVSDEWPEWGTAGPTSVCCICHGVAEDRDPEPCPASTPSLERLPSALSPHLWVTQQSGFCIGVHCSWRPRLWSRWGCTRCELLRLSQRQVGRQRQDLAVLKDDGLRWPWESGG